MKHMTNRGEMKKTKRNQGMRSSKTCDNHRIYGDIGGVTLVVCFLLRPPSWLDMARSTSGDLSAVTVVEAPGCQVRMLTGFGVTYAIKVMQTLDIS